MLKKSFLTAVLVLSFVISPVASADTASDLQAQINSILAKIQSLQAALNTQSNTVTTPVVTPVIPVPNPPSDGGGFCHTFTKYLVAGSRGQEVTALTSALTLEGLLDGKTNTFDDDIASAVIDFQTKYGIKKTGTVGPLTRAKLNALYGKCGSPDARPILNPGTLNKTIKVGESVQQVFVLEGNRWAEGIPYKWNFGKGSMPNGLAIELFGAFSGRLYGTPTETGNFSFTVEAYSEKLRTSAVAYVNLTVLPGDTSTSDATATVTKSPTLELTYDSSNQEALLTATFDVSVTAGKSDLILYTKMANASFFDQNNSSGYSNSLRLNVGVAAGEKTDAYGRDYTVVSAGKSVQLSVVLTGNPKQMFAGTYYAKLANLNAQGSNINDIINIPVSQAQTSTKTIIGEVSPYINSVTPVGSGAGQDIQIKGVRFNRGRNVANVGGTEFVINNWSTSDNKTYVIQFSPTKQGIAAGSYPLYIVNEDLGREGGKSNVVWVQIGGGPTKDPITVLSPNGGEEFINGQSYTLRWTSSNLRGSVVDIYVLSSDGTVRGNIAMNVANTGSYVWTVPQSQLEGAHRFYVSSGNIVDQSDNVFEIWKTSRRFTRPAVSVLSPNGGEVLSTDSDFVISFTPAYGKRHYFNLVDENNRRWELLSAMSMSPVIGEARDKQSITITKSVFSVYNIVPGRYKIELCSQNSEACDRSDSYFNITRGSTGSDSSISASPENTFEDRAGIWENFGSGPGNANKTTADWNWTAILKVQGSKTVQSMSMTHNNGYEAWSTSRTNIYGKQPYPLVVVVRDNNNQLNKYYDQSFGFGEGTYTLKLYGQVETEKFSGAKLDVSFTDGTSISAEVPASNYTPNNSQPSITVTSPNGGESYQTGRTVNVTWSSANLLSTDMVKIELGYTHTDPTYAAGTYFEDWIVEKAVNTGSYSWQIPEFYATGVNASSFTIKVSAGGVSDYSNGKFTITPFLTKGDITVTRPIAGDVYGAGGTIPITWVSNAGVAYSVSLLRNSDPFFQRLSLDTTGTAPNLNWKIPTNIPDGSDYYLKINESANATRNRTGYSGLFSIRSGSTQQPSITVLSPNGGESFVQGQNIPITWKGGDFGDTNALPFYTFPSVINENAPGYPMFLGQARSSSYSFQWDGKTVCTGTSQSGVCQNPYSIPPGNYKILVQARELSDKSDSYFTLTAPGTTRPVVTALYPTSGPAGTVVTVTGSNFGSSNSILFNGKIDGISSNGTSLQFTVPQNTPVGSYGTSVMKTINDILYNSNTLIFSVISPTASSPNVLCSASASNSGTPSVSWTAQVSGGRSPYQYSWSVYNDVSNYVSGSTQSSAFTASYSSAGSKEAVVRVSDASGKSTSASCSGVIPVAVISVQPSISVTPSSISSGGSVKLNFTFPSNTVRSTLYLSCPGGVSAAGSTNICNQTIDLTSNLDYTVILSNTSTESQNVVPNYYVYTSDNPTYARGASSQITVLSGTYVTACAATVINGYSVPARNNGESATVNTTNPVSNGTRSASTIFTCSNGAFTASPETANITCNNGYLSVGTQCVATAVPAPTVDLKVNGSDGPVSVSSGALLTLSHTSTNATSCANNWDNSNSNLGLSSSGVLYGPITGAKTFIVTCSGSSSGVSASDSVIVKMQDISGGGGGGGGSISPTLSFVLDSSTEDRAGAWGNFKAGAGNVNRSPGDWNWTATLILPVPSKSITSIKMDHLNGYEHWSTNNSSDYPLVIVENAEQLNYTYGDIISLFPGSHTLKIYGQKESTTFAGSKLTITFTDGTSVSATIQASGTATAQTSQMASALESARAALESIRASLKR